MQIALYLLMIIGIFLVSMAVLVSRTATKGTRLAVFLIAASSPLIVPLALVMSILASPDPSPVPARLEEVENEIAARRRAMGAKVAGVLLASTWKQKYQDHLNRSAERIHEQVRHHRTRLT